MCICVSDEVPSSLYIYIIYYITYIMIYILYKCVIYKSILVHINQYVFVYI